MGVDSRLFNNLASLGLDFSVIEWKTPLPGESIAEYAHRMSEDIKEEKFVLGGVSFGGVVANEISKLKKPEKLILISTVKSSRELPLHLKVLRSLPLHKTLPEYFYNKGSVFARLIRPVFGKMTQNEKKLFNQMVSNVNPVYLKWAINAIINWESEDLPDNFIHIHGTHDAIFPLCFIQAPYVAINGGSHLMICSRAKEIAPLIQIALSEVGQTSGLVG